MRVRHLLVRIVPASPTPPDTILYVDTVRNVAPPDNVYHRIGNRSRFGTVRETATPRRHGTVYATLQCRGWRTVEDGTTSDKEGEG